MKRSRLDVVLRLARLGERQALRALGEAQRVAAGLQTSLEEFDTELAAAREQLAPAPGRGSSAAELVAAQRYVRLLEHRARTLAGRLELARGAEREALERVAAARARVRGIQNAIDRRAARAAQQARRKEQRRIDELVRNLQALEEKPDGAA